MGFAPLLHFSSGNSLVGIKLLELRQAEISPKDFSCMGGYSAACMGTGEAGQGGTYSLWIQDPASPIPGQTLLTSTFLLTVSVEAKYIQCNICHFKDLAGHRSEAPSTFTP